MNVRHAFFGQSRVEIVEAAGIHLMIRADAEQLQVARPVWPGRERRERARSNEEPAVAQVASGSEALTNRSIRRWTLGDNSAMSASSSLPLVFEPMSFCG